jgi:hypothetical protein
MSQALLSLRQLVATRKWIVWVALVVLLLVIANIGLELLPHHDLNTLLQYEEKPDGVRELIPNSARTSH